MKKITIGIIIGIIISCTVGVLASTIVPSTIVTYQDKTLNTALDELYDSVNLLKTRGDAEASQILTGKKAIVKGIEITGTMANRGNLNWTPSTGTSYTVPSGYYSGGTLNSSGAYNTGYSAGVSAADNRANANSTNYKTGYNNGYSAGVNAGTVKVKTVTQEVNVGGGWMGTITTPLSGINEIIGYGAHSSTGATGTAGATNPAIQVVSSSCTPTKLSVTYNHQKSQGSYTVYTWYIYYR